MRMRNQVLTLAEVAAYLKVHPSTIYRMVRCRQIPAFRVGRDWRFTRKHIDEWRRSLEQRSIDPGAPASDQREIFAGTKDCN